MRKDNRVLYARGSNQYRLLPKKGTRNFRGPKKSYKAPLTLLAGVLFLIGATNIPTDSTVQAIEIISPVVEVAGDSAKTSPSDKTPILAEGEVTLKLPREMRAKKLQAYLQEKNSPLAEHAEYMVELADLHDISWTLVAAISGKESSFGNAIKENSNNAWGIMAWDAAGNRSIRTFDSWKDGIEYTTKLLANHYREDMNRGIQARYCPSFECSDTWVTNVTGFQEEINK